jgi:hypothetical protein
MLGETNLAERTRRARGMTKRILSVLVVCGLVLLTTSIPVLAAGKTHDVRTEIVSVDAKAMTITIKDDKGQNKVVPVLASAQDSLKTVKAGDKVMLTCQDDDKGGHQGVAAIKVESAEKHG